MDRDKILKAFLVFVGACCGAIVTQEYFSPVVKAYAAVTGAGCGALLAYILRPTSDPVEVTGKDGGPVKTTEAAPTENSPTVVTGDTDKP